jgi:hypothetical protein
MFECGDKCPLSAAADPVRRAAEEAVELGRVDAVALRQPPADRRVALPDLWTKPVGSSLRHF